MFLGEQDLHFAASGAPKEQRGKYANATPGSGENRFYNDSSEELWINSGNLMTCGDYGNGNNFSAVFR